MTCGAHTASQPWRRHRRARDTCPETPDINRATSRAPRALSCTYTFDPVQWVGTCKRNQSDPTKHALTMMLARRPVSLVGVYILGENKEERVIYNQLETVKGGRQRFQIRASDEFRGVSGWPFASELRPGHANLLSLRG